MGRHPGMAHRSGQWICSRSTHSTPSRVRQPSTAAVRLAPSSRSGPSRSQGMAAGPATLVATVTRPTRPDSRSQRPRKRSDRPCVPGERRSSGVRVSTARLSTVSRWGPAPASLRAEAPGTSPRSQTESRPRPLEVCTARARVRVSCTSQLKQEEDTAAQAPCLPDSACEPTPRSCCARLRGADAAMSARKSGHRPPERRRTKSHGAQPQAGHAHVCGAQLRRRHA